MRIHFLAALLALGLAAGCKAQTPPAGGDLSLNRHIEVLVRSQFNVPPSIDIAIGERKPSQFPGFDTIPIVLSHGDRHQNLDLLISADNKTLARMETFSLDKDPLLSIDVAGRPVRGNPGARITVVNYDDLECPYCAQMHHQLFPATLDRYKGLVRFVYKDFPLTEIHPWAMRASVDANCLASQSGEVYWAYVDYLHGHGQEVNGEKRDTAKSFEALDRIARQQATLAHLDAGKLDACLAKQDETAVRASMKEGTAIGVDGTPALVIDGEKVNGAQPQAEVWKVIDRALKAAGIQPPVDAPPPAAAPEAPTAK
ncbi:MAG: thioredoxin domain-containing protein [Terracidiphilus sp.]